MADSENEDVKIMAGSRQEVSGHRCLLTIYISSARLQEMAASLLFIPMLWFDACAKAENSKELQYLLCFLGKLCKFAPTSK